MSYFDDLPIDRDREPFPVTDSDFDAPIGAVLELTGSGYPGWWQRQNDHEWVPVVVSIPDNEPPGEGDLNAQ